MHPPGGTLSPLYRFLGMCSLKGYGFLAVLVINMVLMLAILVSNMAWFLHSIFLTGLELGMCFRRS